MVKIHLRVIQDLKAFPSFGAIVRLLLLFLQNLTEPRPTPLFGLHFHGWARSLQWSVASITILGMDIAVWGLSHCRSAEKLKRFDFFHVLWSLRLIIRIIRRPLQVTSGVPGVKFTINPTKSSGQLSISSSGPKVKAVSPWLSPLSTLGHRRSPQTSIFFSKTGILSTEVLETP